MGEIMSKFNLTLDQLKKGKDYKIKYCDGAIDNSLVHIKGNRLLYKTGIIVDQLIGASFKEVVEFEELSCFINFDSKTIFFKRKDEASESCENNLDYKVDGGKLFVKKRG